ncbi:phosphonate C-P lyase system protein PhnG [Undibacterium sp. Jales W-56]|uniref:phosphonate C-P lyase system protein PhnG n=1 Tax=Undibacterium sp. Jales W-56 TaxID=2897325 RepID=UPI0021D22BF2|nr:phosphonate C-P lyase system protein PhnG [Undibacterium sp. Jales W-56]MCU6435820.1 phosphonate C-P lyase system protein PhnG [Undibacterium sp. Jales W-56]
MRPSPPPLDVTYARAQWPRLFLACPAESVRALARSLCEQHQVQDIQLPQSGLALLKLRDSAQGDAYYPGEVPLAIAHVRVTSSDGACVEGAAQLLDDRTSLARAIAVLDAVLAAQLSGHAEAQALLTTGAALLAEQTAQRRALMASTRVDFALLGTTEEENDDE